MNNCCQCGKLEGVRLELTNTERERYDSLGARSNDHTGGFDFNKLLRAALFANFFSNYHSIHRRMKAQNGPKVVMMYA